MGCCSLQRLAHDAPAIPAGTDSRMTMIAPVASPIAKRNGWYAIRAKVGF